MKMYLPFGDWSQDGHRLEHEVLIDAPSMNHLLDAQIAICEKYGEDFFEEYASEYECSTLSPIIWQALIDTNYPIERMQYFEENNDWSGLISVAEAIAIDSNPIVTLEFVEDTFIWLLNAFGAQIRICEPEEEIPTISNWTCRGFKTVGYGCFYP